MTSTANSTSTPNKNCTLRSKPSEVAFPSLKQCYIYTRDSCCTSSHDSQIAEALSNLISTPCVDSFPDLIQYFCFGCYNGQPFYVDDAKKTVTICKDFAERVWSGAANDLKSLS
jgi:hypothetical protein